MKTLFEATIDAVDRAAICYAKEDDDIDPIYWEPMYGQWGSDAYSLGMLPWILDDHYKDC